MGQQSLVTTQQNTLSPQAQGALNQSLNRTLTTANGPNYWGQIGAQPVVGLNGIQTGALSGFQQGANYQPQMTTAGNITQYAGGTGPGGLSLNGANLSGYMSPYTQNVINSQVALEKQQDGQQQQQLIGNQTAAGAFGGDRSALAQSALAGQQALANNATNAGLYQSAFQNAQQQANTDINRQLQAGTAQSQLGLQSAQGNQFAGLQGANLNLQGSNQVYNVGQAQQQAAQAAANSQYQNSLNQAQFPYQQAQFLNSGISGLLGYNGTQTNTSPGPSTVSQIAGLGTSLAGLGGLLFGGGNNGGGLGGAANAIGNGLSSVGNAIGDGVSNAADWIGGLFADGGVVGGPVSGLGYADGGSVDDGEEPYVLADGTPMTEATAPWGPDAKPAATDGNAADVLAALRAQQAAQAPQPVPVSGLGGDPRADAASAQNAPVPDGTAAGLNVPTPDAGPAPSTTAGLAPMAPATPVSAPVEPPVQAGLAAPAAPPPDRVAASASAASPMPQPGLPMSPVGGPGYGGAAVTPASIGGGSSWAMPVLAAGLGMLASRSPFALNGIGEGGLAGLQQYMSQQQLAPKIALENQQVRGATMQNDMMQGMLYGTGPAAGGNLPGGIGGPPVLPPLQQGSGPNGEVTPTDLAAQQSVQGLLRSQYWAERRGDAKGVAAISAQVKAIGDSGQVALADGSFAPVPGALRGIAAKAYAEAEAKVGPALQQHSGEVTLNTQGAINTAAGTAPIDVAKANATKAGSVQIENDNVPVNVGTRDQPVWRTRSQMAGGATDLTTPSGAFGSLPPDLQGPFANAMLRYNIPQSAWPTAAAVIKQESSLNPSTHGGLGSMTPETAHELGYDPAALSSNPALGMDAMANYYSKMLQKAGGDPMKAAVLYNGGGDPDYGQHVQNRMASKTASAPGMVMQPLPGGGTAVQNTAPAQNTQYAHDLKDTDELSDSLQKSQTDQTRLLTLRSLIAASKPGANGELRASISNWAETYLPAGAAKALENNIGKLPDAASAQEFAKLALQEAGDQERGTLGARGSLGAITLFTKSNPSLNMQPSADNGIINARLIAHQMDNDYITGAQSWVNEKGQAWTNRTSNYQPLSQYDQQWNKQRNTQVGFAAMQAINGVPFKSWAKGLTQQEGQRTMQLIYRADPAATVMGDDGQTWSVSRFAPKQEAQQ